MRENANSLSGAIVLEPDPAAARIFLSCNKIQIYCVLFLIIFLKN